MNIEQYLTNHWMQFAVGWVLVQNFLKAVQDAVDAQPKDLKPPFGYVLYYMQAVGGYLFAGTRIKNIDQPEVKQ